MKHIFKIQWMPSLAFLLSLAVSGYAQDGFNDLFNESNDEAVKTKETATQVSDEVPTTENAAPAQSNPIPGLEENAATGDAYAQAVLGWHYWIGFLVAKDAQKASELFWKSARQKHPLGLYGVADLVNDGEGGNKKDVAKAKALYQAARPALESLAASGDAYAQRALGRMYAYGLGMETNNADASKWFRKASDQGLASAQSSLGGMYFSGLGVQKNYTEAAKWVRKASDQGLASAQSSLGKMYYSGLGVQKNYAEAAKWFRKAAEQGDDHGQIMLSMLYLQGEGVQENYAEAAKWIRKAAEQGHSVGQRMMGRCYEGGLGVKQDYPEALKWYQKSAAQGDEDAKMKVAELAPRVAPPMEFDYEAVKAKAGPLKDNTLVFKDFYLGMPIEDALGLINHRMGLAQVSATPTEDTSKMSQAKNSADFSASHSAAMLQAMGAQVQGMSRAQLKTQGFDDETIDALGISDPTDSYRMYSKQGIKFIARNTQERSFAVADASGKVVSLELSRRLIDQLFSAKDTPAEEFLQTFITAYDIPKLDSQMQKIMATIMGISTEIGYQNIMTHRNPKGFEVTYYGDTIITEDGGETFANTPPEGTLAVKKIGTEQERQSSFD